MLLSIVKIVVIPIGLGLIIHRPMALCRITAAITISPTEPIKP
jgi:hypothetical protein